MVYRHIYINLQNHYSYHTTWQQKPNKRALMPIRLLVIMIFFSLANRVIVCEMPVIVIVLINDSS